MVGFHRRMDEFTFDCYVRQKLSIRKTLNKFGDFRLAHHEHINLTFFSRSYCNDYIKTLYKRMKKEKKARQNGFTKEKDFVTTVIKRFVRNKCSRAYLPQENIAQAWGCSQRTVSRYLKKMCEQNYIYVVEKHDRLKKKATVYRLAHKGYRLFEKLYGKAIDVVNTVKESIVKVVNSTIPNKKRNVSKRNDPEHIMKMRKLEAQLGLPLTPMPKFSSTGDRVLDAFLGIRRSNE